MLEEKYFNFLITKVEKSVTKNKLNACELKVQNIFIVWLNLS